MEKSYFNSSTMYDTERLTLYEVSQRIQDTIYDRFAESIWVIAEIGEMKEHRTGHCYMELVEKDESKDLPKAKARATIWGSTYRVLKPFFEMATGRKLGAGIKVLVLCEIQYHPVYGLSLNIRDIDPSYTIGDIEKRKQETIQRLMDEGIFDMNKQIPMPMLPKRIAVISSRNAAGFEDFANQLDSNSSGYSIQYHLFETDMQGEKAENTIIDALDSIYRQSASWDIVAIIRGGGSQSDLACFDGYMLASHIAQFPLPIVSGIGHEKDTTVADLVANTRLKTPTAAAEFIIGTFFNAEGLLKDIVDEFISATSGLFNESKHTLIKIQNKFTPLVLRKANSINHDIHHRIYSLNEATDRLLLRSNNNLHHKMEFVKTKYNLIQNDSLKHLKTYSTRIEQYTKGLHKAKSDELISLEKMVNALNPKNVLKRGFSITLMNGKVISGITQVQKGDIISSKLTDGEITSRVEDANFTRIMTAN